MKNIDLYVKKQFQALKNLIENRFVHSNRNKDVESSSSRVSSDYRTT